MRFRASHKWQIWLGKGSLSGLTERLHVVENVPISWKEKTSGSFTDIRDSVGLYNKWWQIKWCFDRTPTWPDIAPCRRLSHRLSRSSRLQRFWHPLLFLGLRGVRVHMATFRGEKVGLLRFDITRSPGWRMFERRTRRQSYLRNFGTATENQNQLKINLKSACGAETHIVELTQIKMLHNLARTENIDWDTDTIWKKNMG